jgi:1-acyl-sn-glycerol-3-phosphate acyltransferase
VAAVVRRHLSICWRGFATGLCFACFGIGAILLSLIWTPLVSFVVRDAQRRARLLRGTIRRSFRAFVGLMNACGVLDYEVHGAARLCGSAALVVASHPTLIDVVFLIAAIPNGVCIVKQRLLDGLPFGPLLRAAGYIGNADPEGSLDGCLKRLAEGVSVVVFPEGSRNPDPRTAKLRRGVAHLIMRSGVAPVPVQIRCDPPTLGHAHHYYEIPARRVHFTIRVGPPIDLADRPPSEPQSIRARLLMEQIRRSLTEEAAYG